MPRKAIAVLFLFAAILASCVAGGDDAMTRRIEVTGNTGKVVFELNDSHAADSLWEQLPLEAEVSNFSSNEKIFYPFYLYHHDLYLFYPYLFLFLYL